VTDVQHFVEKKNEDKFF